MADDRRSTHERTLRGGFLWSDVLIMLVGIYPRIGVPVVPCGPCVVISGILPGGTPGFRNALLVFCTLPGRLASVMCFVFGVFQCTQGSTTGA